MQTRLAAKPGREIPRAQHRPAARPLAHYFSKADRDQAMLLAYRDGGYPGYDSIITKDKATIGKILKENGYRTAWFGKTHNTPEYQSSQAGPFDQWPTGMGLEYFYGFMGGDTNQWDPMHQKQITVRAMRPTLITTAFFGISLQSGNCRGTYAL